MLAISTPSNEQETMPLSRTISIQKKPMKQPNQIETEDEKEDIVIYLGTRDSEGEAPEETFSAPIELEQNITLGILSDDLNPDRKQAPNGKFLVLRLGTDVAKNPDVFAIVLNTENPQHKKKNKERLGKVTTT